MCIRDRQCAQGPPEWQAPTIAQEECLNARSLRTRLRVLCPSTQNWALTKTAWRTPASNAECVCPSSGSEAML
eukprot:3550671-Lingulodinium_polyedra.AAC.1